MKAVIYARYSSDSQREESIEGQIRECTDFANTKNYTIIAHYIDRALSAKTDDRPEFQHMIKNSEKHLFDTVLVWKLDRFSRDRYDSAYYKHVLKKNGVKVISATENISEGPEGIILESMLEGMAEYYSAELKVKVQRGHKENALKCKHNGGTTPYGFYIEHKEHVLQPDPQSAPIVLEIFRRFDKGEKIADIMRNLNNRGIRCSYGKPFTKGRINAILRNRRYIGEYKYGDIVVPGGIPAIVDQDLFDRVNKRLDIQRTTKGCGIAKQQYLLTSKLFCGECGKLMAGECGTSHVNKHVHHYYKCSGAKSNKCFNNKGIKKGWIEKVAVLLTIDIVFQEEAIKRIADRVIEIRNKEDPALPAMRIQLRECERHINNIMSAIEEGILTQTTKSRLEELELERDNLSCSISKLELNKNTMSRDDIISWINKYRYSYVNSEEFQRQLIDSFIHSIYVFEDKFVFIYNISDKVIGLSKKDIMKTLKAYLDHSSTTVSPKFVYMKTAFGYVTSKSRMDAIYRENSHARRIS